MENYLQKHAIYFFRDEKHLIINITH